MSNDPISEARENLAKLAVEGVTHHERRKHARRILRAPALVRVGDGPIQRCRTLDVSVSGLGLLIPLNPRQGTRCVLSFHMPPGDDRLPPWTTPAVAMHSIYDGTENGFKVGMQFSDLPEVCRSLIVRYVNGEF